MLLVFDSNYVSWVISSAFWRGLSYDGNRTEIIFGFMKQLVSLFENFEPDQVAFCWDSRQSKRRDIYPEYKNNRRKDMLEEDKDALNLIYAQFEEMKSYTLPALGFSNVFEVNGYESDDLIANVVWGKNPDETIVISSDTDLYQLLDYCSIYAITKGQTTNKEIFRRHYGIEPIQWVKVKAIAGCSTDNVKGIMGIGEKKAIDYLIGKLNKGKMFLKIEDSQEIIGRNIQLVALPFAGTPTPKLRKNTLTMDKFRSICREYGMDSLLEKKSLAKWEKNSLKIV